LKSTETAGVPVAELGVAYDFSNFGSLKSTETPAQAMPSVPVLRISAISAR